VCSSQLAAKTPSKTSKLANLRPYVIDFAFLLHDLCFGQTEVVLNLVVQFLYLLLKKLLLVDRVIGVWVRLHRCKIVSLLLGLVQVLSSLDFGRGDLLWVVLCEVLLQVLPRFHAVANVVLVRALSLTLVDLTL